MAGVHEDRQRGESCGTKERSIPRERDPLPGRLLNVRFRQVEI